MHPCRRAFLGASFAGLAAPFTDAAAPPAPAVGKEDPDAPFRPDTLMLTWRRDPTTTMTVQWVGTAGETKDTAVYFRPDRGFVWHKQPTTARKYAKTDFKVFRAELTGLSPGTDYRFKIGKESPWYSFRTMPAKATDTIQFVSGGDCGVNAHAVANNAQAARLSPAFTLLGGDLGYDNGMSVATSLAFLRNYSKAMTDEKGRMIPLIACVGNHEVEGGYGKKRDKAPFFYALFDGLYPDAGHAALDFGDYLSLVLLDTGHTTPIAGAQTDWLEKTLKARKDHPHVIVAGHVPAYPSARSEQGVKGKEGTGEANRKHWAPLFDKYRVPVVLEHHDHTFKRSKPLLDGTPHSNGVLYLGDGSWGRLRPPRKAEKVPYLALTSEKYHLSLHRIQGDERFHLALDERGKVVDVCRSGQRKAGSVRASD
jgi:hypothetical protein